MCIRDSSYAIEQLEKETNDAVIIAIHYNDPVQFEQDATLRSHFGVTSWPTALIDRAAGWTYPEPSNISQVTGKLSKKSYAALAMESSLDGDMLTIKVKLKMGYNYQALKLGLYILEDGLVYDQRNWTSYYQGDPIVDFEHHNVLRKAVTGLLGDQIPSDKVGHDKEFEKEFANYVGSNFGVALSNGTAALEAGYKAIGIKEGDEIITTPRTFIATSMAAINLGAKPIFADVEEVV